VFRRALGPTQNHI